MALLCPRLCPVDTSFHLPTLLVSVTFALLFSFSPTTEIVMNESATAPAASKQQEASHLTAGRPSVGAVDDGKEVDRIVHDMKQKLFLQKLRSVSKEHIEDAGRNTANRIIDKTPCILTSSPSTPSVSSIAETASLTTAGASSRVQSSSSKSLHTVASSVIKEKVEQIKSIHVTEVMADLAERTPSFECSMTPPFDMSCQSARESARQVFNSVSASTTFDVSASSLAAINSEDDETIETVFHFADGLTEASTTYDDDGNSQINDESSSVDSVPPPPPMLS